MKDCQKKYTCTYFSIVCIQTILTYFNVNNVGRGSSETFIWHLDIFIFIFLVFWYVKYNSNASRFLFLPNRCLTDRRGMQCNYRESTAISYFPGGITVESNLIQYSCRIELNNFLISFKILTYKKENVWKKWLKVCNFVL